MTIWDKEELMKAIWVKSFLLSSVVVAALLAVVLSKRIRYSDSSLNIGLVDVVLSNFVVG